MKGRRRKLSLEQKNLLVVAIMVLVVIGGFRIWEAWRQKSAIFVPVWKRSIGKFVYWIALSGDGKFLAVFSEQGKETALLLLQVPDGRLIRTINVGWARTFAISPDGRKVAVVGVNEVHLLRLTDGKILWRWKHKGQVYGVNFSPDGNIVASEVYGGDICLLRITDGTPLQVLRCPDYPWIVLAFSPDGHFLAAAGGEICAIWRISDGRLIRRLVLRSTVDRTNSVPVVAVAFSPDGRWLAAGDLEGGLHLWSVDKWSKIWQVRGHERGMRPIALTNFAFSSDGRWLISAGTDGKVKLWKVLDGNEISEMRLGRVIEWGLLWFFVRIRTWSSLKFAVRPKLIRAIAFHGEHVAVAWEHNMVGLFRVRLPKQ